VVVEVMLGFLKLEGLTVGLERAIERKPPGLCVTG